MSKMTQKVLIDNYEITPTKLETENEGKRKVYLEFLVEHKDYHDITTLLYKNDFTVNIPEIALQFEATITNYSTSITNLYEEGAVRSEEHTSELQSRGHLVCRLLL